MQLQAQNLIVAYSSMPTKSLSKFMMADELVQGGLHLLHSVFACNVFESINC